MVVTATAISSMAAVPTTATSSVATTTRPVREAGTQQPGLAQPQRPSGKTPSKLNAIGVQTQERRGLVTEESQPGLLAFVTTQSGSSPSLQETTTQGARFSERKRCGDWLAVWGLVSLGPVSGRGLVSGLVTG